MARRIMRTGCRPMGVVILSGLLWAGVARTQAQIPPIPDPGPPPAVTPIEPGVAPPTTRELALEARILQLEQMVQQLSIQMSQSPPGGATVSGVPGAAGGGMASGGGDGRPAAGQPGGPASGNNDGSAAEDNTPGGTNTVPVGSGPRGEEPNAAPSQSGGVLAPGQSSPPNPPPSPRFRMPATTISSPLNGKFGPGFEVKTEDDEFVLQFHNLTQFDGRFYEQNTGTGRDALDTPKDTFAFPRQWWMFSGRIGKPYEYFLSFQNGFDTFSILDVFLNFHYDDRIQFKVGRFKTPFTYEFYTEPIQGLISPERSLFFNNFALNRSLGLQLWGRLFNKTAPLDYAVGLFNNSRNSFLDVNSDQKNVLAYLNWRPFAQLEDSPLENFVFGGSVMAGSQSNPPLPSVLRTIVPTTGNASIGVPFLGYNATARESGPRVFWDLHAAWYYKHTSLIAEWQSGYQSYAPAADLFDRTRVGVQSFYVQAGHFITGETVSGRNVVKPLKDFDIRKGKFGLGAIELSGRFNALDIDRSIFSGGFADPNRWTRDLYTTDVGVNWYLNQYLKFTFDWNHAVFGTPVQYSARGLQKTSDLFLMRFQLYF
ncbi:OprO/OprP family phosphate-selective porin [Tundrisphaera sp. TA3]|uniref:OprO/OprP family phosphate-selective porin n=1 Tax=Tundrisphaera sp. TA3 TaxID=3435775 RepID=UPI003EC04B37